MSLIKGFIKILRSKYVALAMFLGLISSIITIVSFIWDNKGSEISQYSGGLSTELIEFLDNNSDNVFKLSLIFNEDESKSITDWCSNDDDRTIFFSIPDNDNPGIELGFHKDDPGLFMNTRFWNSVHTSGYFKVHSRQGPYQGWMSVTLRSVGLEHINNH